MHFYSDHLSSYTKSQPNFPLLEELLTGLKLKQIDGIITLNKTAFLKHFRLFFSGIGRFNGTILYGPSFHPMLLEVPALAPELREIVDEFFRQIQELEDPPPPEFNVRCGQSSLATT